MVCFVIQSQETDIVLELSSMGGYDHFANLSHLMVLKPKNFTFQGPRWELTGGIWLSEVIAS